MGKGVGRWGVGLLLTALVCGLARPIAGEEKASNSGQPGKTAPGTSLIDSLSFTSRQEPIHIRSHDLEFLYNEKRIIYRGDVVTTQGDVTVKSDLLTVTYEEPTTEDGATTERRTKDVQARSLYGWCSERRREDPEPLLDRGQVDESGHAARFEEQHGVDVGPSVPGYFRLVIPRRNS